MIHGAARPTTAATRWTVLGLAVALVAGSGTTAADTAHVGPAAVSFARVVPASRSASSIPGLKPADIASAYGLTGGTAGLTVGVVIPYDTAALESDLAVYRSTTGLPPCTTANGCFSKVDASGGTAYPSSDAGWSLEASLDVDSVSASCPACHILVVEAASSFMSDLGPAVDEAVRLGAAAVSNSWGAPENGSTTSYSTQYFTHPGVPILAATGDSAYPQAYIPATLPKVIAVGGTSLNAAGASAARIARSATDGVVVGNGGTTPATAVDDHVRAYQLATAALRSARARATTQTAALTKARRAAALTAARATRARAAVAVATKRVTVDAKAITKARTSGARATARKALTRAARVLAAARKAQSAARTANVRAGAAVVAANVHLSATARSVASLSATVDTDRAVVEADRAAGSTPPPAPVVRAPPQTAPVGTAPVGTAPVQDAPAPAPTAAPLPVPTPDPILSTTPTPTPVPTPNAAPTARFSHTASGLVATLDASASSDPDGTIASYAWDFGDGTTAGGATATHAYASAGSWTVTLTVTDDGGATASASATVGVTSPIADPQASRALWRETAWNGAGSGCSGSVAKPAWQTDTLCTTRTVADIAAVGDGDTGLAVYDTAAVGQGYTADGWLVVGGTSLATPLVAGMIVRSGRAGHYDDASPFYADRSALWDVSAGSNGSCGGSAICTAGIGFDGPTGLGSPMSLSSF